MNTGLTLYIEKEIIPRYKGFDKAHREDHVRMVIEQSLEIARHYGINLDMVYAIAAFHDLGLEVDRKTHHLESGRIIREDPRLREWFSQEEIETMAQAVEDHGHRPTMSREASTARLLRKPTVSSNRKRLSSGPCSTVSTIIRSWIRMDIGGVPSIISMRNTPKEAT